VNRLAVSRSPRRGKTGEGESVKRKVTTHYKAIVTKYHGPTNARGSRISASDLDGNRVVVSMDYTLNSDSNHERAAVALADKMGWKGNLAGGALKHGYAFVFVS